MHQYNCFFLLLLLCCLVRCRPQNDDNFISVFRKSCEVEEKATGESKPCKFPFIYNNQTYFGCTNVENEEGVSGVAWCSTKTNILNEHIEGEATFGNCNTECLTEEEGHKSEIEEINLTIRKTFVNVLRG